MNPREKANFRGQYRPERSRLMRCWTKGYENGSFYSAPLIEKIRLPQKLAGEKCSPKISKRACPIFGVGMSRIFSVRGICWKDRSQIHSTLKTRWTFARPTTTLEILIEMFFFLGPKKCKNLETNGRGNRYRFSEAALGNLFFKENHWFFLQQKWACKFGKRARRRTRNRVTKIPQIQWLKCSRGQKRFEWNWRSRLDVSKNSRSTFS